MTALTSREVISVVQPVSEELFGAVVTLDHPTVATAARPDRLLKSVRRLWHSTGDLL